MKREWMIRLVALLLAALLALPAALAEAVPEALPLEASPLEAAQVEAVVPEEMTVDAEAGGQDGAAVPEGDIPVEEVPVEDVPAEDMETLELSELAVEADAEADELEPDEGEEALPGDEEAPEEGEEAEALYSWSEEAPEEAESFFYGDTKRTFNLFLAVPFTTDGIAVKKWKSSNDKIVHIENHGDFVYMYMCKKGTAKVTATRKDGKKRTVTITVKDLTPVTRIQLEHLPNEFMWEGEDTYSSKIKIVNNSTITLTVGEICYIRTILFNNDDPVVSLRTKKTKWKVDNKSIAQIKTFFDKDEMFSVFAAKKIGKTKVTVTSYNGKKATFTIKVVGKGDLPTKIELGYNNHGGCDEFYHGKTITVAVGNSVLLKPCIYYNDKMIDYDDDLFDPLAWLNTWTISNKKIAKIEGYDGGNRYYLLTCKKPGKTKLTVTTFNGKKCTVTIKAYRNIMDKIYPKPSTKTIKNKYKGQAAVILKSVEYDFTKSENDLIVECYVVNGTSKKRTVNIGEFCLYDEAYNPKLRLGQWNGIKVKNVPAYGCKVVKLKIDLYNNAVTWLPEAMDYDELFKNTHPFGCTYDCSF